MQGNAVVLLSNVSKKWASISLNGQLFMKKGRLLYWLRLRSVPSYIMTKRIETHELFAGTVLKTISSGQDIIVELSSKSVYDKCLERRVLRVDDQIIDITSHSSSNKEEDDEINASNWYETEMMTGKTNIMQFINEPKHRIFQLKWNCEAFLEQFNRQSLSSDHHADNNSNQREIESNHRRHLLRMTVMLNTIGIVKKGSYCVDRKPIQLKLGQVQTIVYNHQSKLERRMTIPSPSGIAYPHSSTVVRVINEDCLVAYEELVSQGYRPLLLNMANATSPGGGYRKGDGAQEENIFRRSDYYRSLDMELDGGQPTARLHRTSQCELDRLSVNERMYPMDQFGAIYTSGLTVFRQPEDTGYAFMKNPMFNVCSIAIAAYRNPKLTENNRLTTRYSIDMRKKIETIFAIAKHHEHDCLVLSAFGCGAFRNPPKHVAAIFKSVIEQYAGFFKEIYFAIIDDHNAGHAFNPDGNYVPFKELLDGLKVEPIKYIMVDMMIGPWRILKTANNREINLSDAKICYLPPCHYGSGCRELENNQHCRQYLHPPLCPLTESSKDCRLQNDIDHMLWFRHLNDDAGSRSKNRTPQNSKLKRHVSNDDDMNDEYQGSGAKRSYDDSQPRLPICPWTPFYCRQYTALSESTNIEALSPDIQNHCRKFRHVCRFGCQCYQTSSLHWQTTIHIAREMCPEGDKCSKLNQETHLNSFSHIRLADIRRLCHFPSYECQDRRTIKHLVRYRHSGNYDHNSVIPYRGLNKQINFIRNQQQMITTIHDYAESLKLKIPISIPYLILDCIRGLSPVYQCSKPIFELILAHNHVMSSERIEQLTNPDMITQSIQRSEHISKIIAQYKDRTITDHIQNYIQAIVFAEYDGRTRQAHSRMAESCATSSPYVPTTKPEKDFNDTIRKEEKNLKNLLNPKEVDTIRQSTKRITEASLNLPTKPVSTDQASEKHVRTVLGPRLRHTDGDIVLVFKREVMHHPDAKFFIQSMTSLYEGEAFIHRPWVKDSRTSRGRLQQLNESQLHCSIQGYDSAAATELLATIGIPKKVIDTDPNTIIKHLSRVSSEQLFEGHLPELIPLDYIEEIYIPHTILTTLTPAAQVSVKTIFRDSLHIIPREVIQCQDHVNEKLVQKLIENIERRSALRGTVITLPPSHLKEYVTLPFTITQVYDQYRQNQKRDSISDDIYIYWQSMYGDMMLVLSHEPIDAAENTRSLICYIAETPSTTPSDYSESYSYLNFDDPFGHVTTMDSRSFLASSDKFHRGCNVDDFLTYCLKLEKNTGQVTLTHAGPNSIYNNETISYKFLKLNLDLNDLNYIQISANSHPVPIENFLVCFKPLPDLHPFFKEKFHPPSSSSNQSKGHGSARPHSLAASKDEKSPGILYRVSNAIGGFFGFDVDPKKLISCSDSVNCLEQTSVDHCKKYSHPCRFSELCHNKDKEPHLTHEPHRADTCPLDKSCKRLVDPFHRARCRHAGRPDFLIPCRDQKRCHDQSFEHRIKYSHGEKIGPMKTTPIEKPQTPSKAPIPPPRSHSKDQKKSSSYGGHNEQTPCRHGSNCHNKNDPGHCSQYSHPAERQAKSTANHNRSKTPDRFGSANYQPSDNVHQSPLAYSDEQRNQQRREIGDHRRLPCSLGTRCRDYDKTHLSKYSHS